MSTNLQNLLRNALLNNTYDYSALHDTLKNTLTNSYSYLYQLQKDYINYSEYTFLSNDIESREHTIGRIYVNKSLQACFDIQYDFIHVINREEFKRSDFRNTTFTFNDMVDNPSIFNKLPIILIDGKAIWDYKLSADNGHFTIILPYGSSFVISPKRNELTHDIIYLDHKIQVFVVDNILYERVGITININKNHILNTQNKTIELDTSLMEKSTDKEGIYFISVHIPNNFGEKYELGTTILPCKYDNNKLVCNLSDEDYDKIFKHTKNLFVSIIFVNNLKSHAFYTGNDYTTCVDNECNIFVLQRDECVPYAMPIPVENLIVIRNRDGNLTYVKNTDAVELYYPNIYRIKDVDRKDGDIYYIYYFYKYSENLQYTPLYDFYYDFLKIHFNNESIEKIIDEIYRGVIDYNSYSENQTTEFIETFNKLLNVGFYNHQYGDIDFTKRYLLESENSGKSPIEYKDETLREWIAEDPKVLRDYILTQNKLYDSVYHLWTKTIDLESRLRTSTIPEFGDEHGEDLNGEYYVFAFQNNDTINGKCLNTRIFIDGLFVKNMIKKHHYFTDYLYIPKDLITSDSYIEIEIYPSYEYTKVLNFKSLDDEKTIELFEPSDKIYPTVEDAYYIAPVGHMAESKSDPNIVENTIVSSTNSININGVTYYETPIYDKSSFQITAQYSNGNFVIETTEPDKPVKFTRLSKFKIKPKDTSVLNNNIVFCITKVPDSIEIKLEYDSFPYIALVGLNVNFDQDYIKVYKNGRLTPKNQYVYDSSYSFPRIMFTEKFKKDDVIYIDIAPYRYKEVYYQKEIQTENTLIDLSNHIDKPFDIRYYDVYLNGRKLSINNVFSITPTKIALVNINSIHHLQIFEKERDYEYFGEEFKNTKYFYTLDDLFNSSLISDEEKRMMIDNIINANKDKNLTIHPNDNTEEEIHFNDFNESNESLYTLLFYVNDLIPKTYLNPDKIQTGKKYIENTFSIIHDSYFIPSESSSRNTEEYNRRLEYEDVYMLDPDIYIEGSNNVENIQRVYSVGHLDDDSGIFNNMVYEDMNKTE